MTHSIIISGHNPESETLKFTHNWGPFWGEDGFGSLPYRYWSERLLEAWIPDDREAAVVEVPAGSTFAVIKRDAEDPWGNRICLTEVEDPTRDEMLGWAIARHSSSGLELEEFFVRPAFRGRGHGRRLALTIAELRTNLDTSLSAWIPHVDATPTKAQDAIFRRMRLRRMITSSTNNRWRSSESMRLALSPGQLLPRRRALPSSSPTYGLPEVIPSC